MTRAACTQSSAEELTQYWLGELDERTSSNWTSICLPAPRAAAA